MYRDGLPSILSTSFQILEPSFKAGGGCWLSRQPRLMRESAILFEDSACVRLRFTGSAGNQKMVENATIDTGHQPVRMAVALLRFVVILPIF
jgi:hypothetical protein